MDIKIIRNTKKKLFETLVYRKSTFSGVFANFKSCTLVIYKFGFRCFSVDYKEFHGRIVMLKEIFRQNFYAETFIDRLLEKK